MKDNKKRKQKSNFKIKYKTSSKKRFSQSSMADKYNRRLSNISAFQDCNKIFQRKTCKMFDLNHEHDHIESKKTLGKLLINLYTSKFNVI